MVQFQDASDNRKSQSGSNRAALVHLVQLVIPVPDQRQLVRRDSFPAVDYVDTDLAICNCLTELDIQCLAGIMNRIVDQIIDNLRNTGPVGFHPNLLIRLQCQPEALAFNHLIVPGECLLNQFSQTERLPLDCHDSCLELGEIQQVIDQFGQMIGFIYDNLDVFWACSRPQVAHYFRISADQRQRSAQVVRDIGQQVPPQLFKPAGGHG